MQELVKKDIRITDFPPKLRKIVHFILENRGIESFEDAVNKLGLNLQSIRTMKSRLKKKGIDIDAYLYEKRIEKVKRYSPYVYDSLVRRAIDGSHPHQKLVSQLLGDLIERQEISTNIGLHFVFSGAAVMPEDIQRIRSDHPVIEVQAEKVK